MPNSSSATLSHPGLLGSGTPSPLALPEREPLRHHAYRAVLSRILAGIYAPGERLRDAVLADTIGVSRTPVREALLRLEREGILEADQGRGFSVAPLRLDEGIEVLRLLRSLECLALDLAEPFDEDQLDALDALAARIGEAASAPEAFELNAQWYAILLGRCTNARLVPMLELARAQATRYMLACLRADGDRVRPASLHLDVTRALRAGNRSGAVTALQAQGIACMEQLRTWLERLESAT